jgi:hypothetical protein
MTELSLINLSFNKREIMSVPMTKDGRQCAATVARVCKNQGRRRGRAEHPKTYENKSDPTVYVIPEYQIA